MKDSVFLHIGMHKTGSTSVQSSLREYDDGSLRFARFDVTNSSKVLGTIFMGSERRNTRHRMYGLQSAQVEALRRDWMSQLDGEVEKTNHGLIVSGERLSALERSEVKSLHEYFSARFRDLQVLVYVRDPIGYGNSMFQQKVKGGAKDISISRPNYKKRFKPYLKLFGRENVQFIEFPPRNENRCVVTDFCDRVGCDTSLLDIQRRNESLSSDAVVLLYHWNRLGVPSIGSPERVKARRDLVALLNEHLPGKFSFDPKILQESLDEDDISWMENVSGISLSQQKPGKPDAAFTAPFFDAVPDSVADRTLPVLRTIAENLHAPTDGDPIVLLDGIYGSLLSSRIGSA